MVGNIGPRNKTRTNKYFKNNKLDLSYQLYREKTPLFPQ